MLWSPRPRLIPDVGIALGPGHAHTIVRGRRMTLHPEKLRRGPFLLAAVLTALSVAGANAQPAAQPPAPASFNRLPLKESPAVAGTPAVQADPTAVPSFWDPRRRPERPDLTRISIIRFLTETDYPPFDYAGPDGAPAGFNVDLAR